jgi:hypothetical protein
VTFILGVVLIGRRGEVRRVGLVGAGACLSLRFSDRGSSLTSCLLIAAEDVKGFETSG